MEFTPDARCVALVRAQVERTLTAWGCAEDDTATAVLVTSELATNAVEHARVPGDLFGVRLTLGAADCLIEVSDSVSVAPRTARPHPDDERGRGLLLVTTLADGFGYRRHPQGGKTVWARLSLIVPDELGGDRNSPLRP